MFDETGYPVAWVPLRLAAHYRYRSLVKKPIWKGRGQYDFSSVDEILKNRLLHAPDQPLLLAVALYLLLSVGLGAISSEDIRSVLRKDKNKNKINKNKVKS